METISKKDFDKIGKDYRSTYSDYDGKRPEWKGRRTAFLPGFGTTLFIEGVSFLVEDDYSHLPILSVNNLSVGAYYRGGEQLREVYHITEEYARENELCYLDRVITSGGDYALHDGATRS